MENITYEYFHDRDTHLHVSFGKSNNVKSHFHRSVEILYLVNGLMWTSVDDFEFTAKPNDIVFVHGYAKHSFVPSTPYEKYVLVIPSNYSNDFNAMLQSNTLDAVLSDREYNERVLKPVFAKLYEERKTMPPLVRKGYLNVILGSLFDHYPSRPLTVHGNIELLVGVLKYIDENYAKDISLDSLAATFGYSKYYFSKLFNRYIGESINNYINMIRLQHFMDEYKRDESVRVSELAFACGFDSLTTFYRYFNKLYKNKPKSFVGVE